MRRKVAQTYQTKPEDTQRFFASKAEAVIKSMLESHLGDGAYTYEHATSKKKAKEITEELRSSFMDRMKGEDSFETPLDSYRIICHVIIGEKKGQGLRIMSKCLWDENNDNYATHTFHNVHSPSNI